MSAYKNVNNESPLEVYTYIADYRHIAANATSSNQVTIGQIPAGGAVAFAYAYEKTALAGASDITLDVGTTGADPDEFIDAWDADGGTPVANSGDACVQGAGNTTYLAGWKPVGIATSDTDILAEWNGTVASLTAGEVVVVIGVLNPAKFVN
jgi:hypothetical protein